MRETDGESGPKKPRTIGTASILGFSLILLFDSCAILRSVRMAESVFLAEEDTELAADSFPILMKTSEILLAGDPENQAKNVTAASLYVMYAVGFIQGEAEFYPDSRYLEREAAMARAGAFFSRALRLLEPALERRSPGLAAALEAAGPAEKAADKAEVGSRLKKLSASDLPLLYWTSAALLAKFSLNPLDLEGGRALRIAPALLEKAEELSPGWNRGAVQELFVTLYAALPDYLGGGRDKAEAAWQKAYAYSKGSSASLYLSRALSFDLPDDDYPAFRKNLELALAVDTSSNPESRLSTEIAKKRARRILASLERYFILPEEENLP